MWILVVGAPQLVDRPDGGSSVLRELGRRVRTADLWDPLENDVALASDPPTAVLVEALDQVDAGKAALQRLRATPALVDVPALLAVSVSALQRTQPSDGFDDVVLVPYVPVELYVRIRRVEWRRSEFESHERIKIGPVIIDVAAHEVMADGRPVVLTHQEFALLRFLAENRGRVYSRQQLLERVWGVDYYGGSRTVDIHVRRLRMKLGPLPLETVRGVGYKMKRRDVLPLVIATGDPAGVGPVVSVRAAAEAPVGQPILLFGDEGLLREAWDREVGAPRAHVSIVAAGAIDAAQVLAHAPSDAGGRAQIAALDAAIDAMRAGVGRALVTAPTSKSAIERAGVPFVGQTEHLARRCGLPDDAVTMMFLGPRLKVALATTHLAISRVRDEITIARVERAIRHLAEALQRGAHGELRIAISGLNPHAGEAGLFGDEEILAIGPAIERARDRVEAELIGPLGAETAFRRAAEGSVDGVVAMFHDQATIASKLLDWGQAVNVTWGLPFVRTSVDHGVAYDAAASGEIDARGMQAALQMAIVLAGER